MLEDSLSQGTICCYPGCHVRTVGQVLCDRHIKEMDIKDTPKGPTVTASRSSRLAQPGNGTTSKARIPHDPGRRPVHHTNGINGTSAVPGPRRQQPASPPRPQQHQTTASRFHAHSPSVASSQSDSGLRRELKFGSGSTNGSGNGTGWNWAGPYVIETSPAEEALDGSERGMSNEITSEPPRWSVSPPQSLNGSRHPSPGPPPSPSPVGHGLDEDSPFSVAEQASRNYPENQTSRVSRKTQKSQKTGARIS